MALPFEKRAVEMALKDKDGNDIAKTKTDTDAAIEALEQAIANKIGFDGVLHIANTHDGISLSDDSKALLSSLSNGAYFVKVLGTGYGNGYGFVYVGPTYYEVFTYYVNKGQLLEQKLNYLFINKTTWNITKDSLTILPRYSQGSYIWDTTPTQNSTNPVTSGGIYAALAAIVPGTKLYKHSFSTTVSGIGFEIQIYSTVSQKASLDYKNIISIMCPAVLVSGSPISSKHWISGYWTSQAGSSLVVLNVHMYYDGTEYTIDLLNVTDTVTPL